MRLLQIYRKDTKRFCLTFTDKKTREPLDITGSTILFTIKTAKEDDIALVTKTVTEHEIPEEGEVMHQTSVFLDSTDTDLEPGYYFYKIKYLAANGDCVTLTNPRMEILV